MAIQDVGRSATDCEEQLQPVYSDMGVAIQGVRRLSRALNALASLTTSGNPAQTNLGVLSSEDLGALLSSLSDLADSHTTQLELTLARAVALSQRH